MSNVTWFYDEETGRYVVKGARILFPNFEGAEQQYNQAGKRNFRLDLPEDLAEELKGRGVYVRERPNQDGDGSLYLVKIGIYQDADVRLLTGGNLSALSYDNFEMIDREFRKGHIINGQINLEFHISRNTRVANGSLYARLDTIVMPLRKSHLLAEYESAMEDDLPFADAN